MNTRTVVVDWIVQYTDPVYQVDGSVKTLHFPNEEKARRHVERTHHQRIDITDIQITKQTSTIVRERI